MKSNVVLKNLPIVLIVLSSLGIADSQLTSNDPGYEVLASGVGDQYFTLEATSTVKINTGMNDAWYNPETGGQGFFIAVFPDKGFGSMAWFTYDTELPPIDATANLGDPGHRWLTAVGPIVGNQVLMNIEMTSGGLFDTATAIDRTNPPGSDGTIVLTFTSCNSGTVEYDISSINRQGTVAIQRVDTENVELCEALSLNTKTLEVCERWNTDRADLSEGTWSGSVSECNAGDISAEGRANALKLVNLYRFIAGLPAVTTDPTRNSSAQECALMMDANDQLNHTPPEDWNCYTTEGKDAAWLSNISASPGVQSVDRYMIEKGNETSMGHRRWILANDLGPIGLGSTLGAENEPFSSASCMHVVGGSGSAGKDWTAWPPPGVFPVEAVKPVGSSSIDDTGWTIQSDSIDLNGAQVSIKEGGIDLTVTVNNLQPWPTQTAISMVPDGWTTTAGKTYEVSVTGISSPINYEVQVVGCQ